MELQKFDQQIRITKILYDSLPFVFKIKGKTITKKYLQNWQYREYLKIANLLNEHFNAGIKDYRDLNYSELRRKVILSKLKIGQDNLRNGLKKQIAIANKVSDISSRVSLGKRKVSVAEISLNTTVLSANKFKKIFSEMMTKNSLGNQFYNFKANPDHFYTSGAGDSQTVVERTGGTPVANEFTITYGDENGLQTRFDPNYQTEYAGVAITKNGIPIGGVRHMMKDNNKGLLHLKLEVEFPATIPSYFIDQHAIHLLVEFSNWITDAVYLEKQKQQ